MVGHQDNIVCDQNVGKFLLACVYIHDSRKVVISLCSPLECAAYIHDGRQTVISVCVFQWNMQH